VHCHNRLLAEVNVGSADQASVVKCGGDSPIMIV